MYTDPDGRPAMQVYHDPPDAEQEPQSSYARLPKGHDNETVRQMRDEFVRNAGGEWLELQPKLVRAFGAAAGVLLHHLIFWSGKSTFASDGWIYKRRDELEELTGLGHREQEKARKILRGEKAWNGKTVQVVEECRLSRRMPTFYRVDLEAVAYAIGIESPRGATEYDDFDFDEPEWPHGATQSFRRATQSPHGAASESTYREPSENSLLQSAPEPAFAEPDAPQINKKDEPDTSRQEQETPPRELELETEADVEALVLGDPNEGDVARLAVRCIERMEGKKSREAFTVAYVAERAREELGGTEPLWLYEEVVERCLREKRERSRGAA